MSCCPWRIAGEEGLQFFGKISASVSHEMKNVLAIVNENAGLLEDLTLMATRDSPVDPERLQKISHAVIGQIRRADSIIKNLNRFAHSTDELINTVDLQEILALLLELASRLAVNRGITLKRIETPGLFVVTTLPFQLENLIWLCLDFAMDASGSGRTVFMRVKEASDKMQIEFFHLEGLVPEMVDSFPWARGKALLDLLLAELEIDPGSRGIRLILPQRILGLQ